MSMFLKTGNTARHKEMVKDWRDETRKLQQKKLQERRMKGYVGELN